MRRERLLPRGSLVADSARNQARNGIDDDRSANLATTQHVVANRDFTVSEIVAYALIDAFVAAADHDHTIEFREFRREFLIETAALCRQQNDGLLCRPIKAFAASSKPKRFQTFKDRFRLKDHAFAAAKRAVVHGAVPIM